MKAKNFDYEMVHPYSDDPNLKIKVSLVICTTYNKVPYGQALIIYKDPLNEFRSFIGIGTFHEGSLH